MIHDTTLKRQNSANEISSGIKPALPSSELPQPIGLPQAIARHLAGEQVSFHTPGHKGRPQSLGKQNDFVFQLAQDVTELPGLDDLSSPGGPILQLEHRLAALFESSQSFLSVNGASACVMAAMMAASSLTDRILVPANLHRSAVSGMALAGLQPVWYQPAWNADFGFYEGVNAESIESALSESDAGALLVVSPTYPGAISDIAAIAALCKKRGVLLIVDEAHGAHLLDPQMKGLSALSCGADIVIHSLHKTLAALTQTGVLHIGRTTRFSLQQIRALLTCLQSSSPSYPLMTSVEHLVDFLETDGGMDCLKRVSDEAAGLRQRITALGGYDIYAAAAFHEPWHLLLKARFGCDLGVELQSRGVGIEASFNQSALLLLGMGTQAGDGNYLFSLLSQFAERSQAENAVMALPPKHSPPPLFQQALAPAQALSLPSHVVPAQEALGRVCVECIAPCPPGTPVVVPGQLLTAETIGYVLQNTGIRSLRVAQKT